MSRGAVQPRAPLPPLDQRIAAALDRVAAPIDAAAARALAAVGGVLQSTLDGMRGLPHCVLADHIAAPRGLGAAAEQAIADTLDLVQVAIELADDLADWEADAAAGRPHVAVLEAIPASVRPALPAVATAAAFARLGALAAGETPGLAVGRAQAQLAAVLAHMAAAQGLTDDAHIAGTADEQGRLLGLALWLDPATPPAEQAAVDTWARAYGRTWELAQRVTEGRVAPATLLRAQERCRRAWPTTAPFAPGGALSLDHLLPRALC